MKKLLDGYLTQSQLAKEFGKTRRCLQLWQTQKIGPPSIKVGNRVLYRRDAVLAWLLEQERK